MSTLDEISFSLEKMLLQKNEYLGKKISLLKDHFSPFLTVSARVGLGQGGEKENNLLYLPRVNSGGMNRCNKSCLLFILSVAAQHICRNRQRKMSSNHFAQNTSGAEPPCPMSSGHFAAFKMKCYFFFNLHTHTHTAFRRALTGRSPSQQVGRQTSGWDGDFGAAHMWCGSIDQSIDRCVLCMYLCVCMCVSVYTGVCIKLQGSWTVLWEIRVYCGCRDL